MKFNKEDSFFAAMSLAVLIGIGIGILTQDASYGFVAAVGVVVVS